MATQHALDGFTPYTDLAYALGRPLCTGRIRISPEDFIVEEDLGLTPDGEGEHVWLWVEKRSLNTEDIARRLGRLAGVKPVAVGYAGMKDRHGVTRQWFSVNMAGKDEPDWSSLASDNLRLRHIARSRRKLQRGALKGNRFAIVVRDLQGPRESLHRRLDALAVGGVPNYFGEQRFGHNNLARARAMLTGEFKPRDKHRRGLYLSAARSVLFNELLSQRVSHENWNTALPGEVLMLAGSNSIFVIDEVTPEIVQRLRDHDIHPTGPLWGQGDVQSRLSANAMEVQALEPFAVWRAGLENAGLRQQRRALRLLPRDLVWRFEDDRLHIAFWLPAGAYATVVIRELLVCS